MVTINSTSSNSSLMHINSNCFCDDMRVKNVTTVMKYSGTPIVITTSGKAAMKKYFNGRAEEFVSLVFMPKKVYNKIRLIYIIMTKSTYGNETNWDENGCKNREDGGFPCLHQLMLLEGLKKVISHHQDVVS